MPVLVGGEFYSLEARAGIAYKNPKISVTRNNTPAIVGKGKDGWEQTKKKGGRARTCKWY